MNILKIEKLDLLISLYIFCIAVSELMGGKTFPLGTFGSLRLNASVAIFVVPLVYAFNDIITEVYGKAKAQSVVRSGLIVVFLIMITSLVFTWLPPSMRFAKTEAAYDAIFGISARIAFASLTAFAIGEISDVLIFIRMRQRFGKKALWLRTNVSNFVSEFLDTAIFISLAFYAFDKPFGGNVGFLVSIILPYWLLKCVMSIIETPLVYGGVRWLKEKK